jgi:hypothetical protein
MSLARSARSGTSIGPGRTDLANDLRVPTIVAKRALCRIAGLLDAEAVDLLELASGQTVGDAAHEANRHALDRLSGDAAEGLAMHVFGDPLQR